LCGYNGTIMAYGQTSSGKTFTMDGVVGDAHLGGIVPRLVGELFDHVTSMNEKSHFQIKVSFFEIYLEKIRDLIDSSKVNLSIHEDVRKVPYVKDATEKIVSSAEETFEIIQQGKINRHVSATKMNQHSSRSHSILSIKVEQTRREDGDKLSGTLFLVDLAGSEKVSKTCAKGCVLNEAKHINKSLSALKNVIAALSKKKRHVPYRDSKLTRILQESLGGNSKTTIIVCCSLALFNKSETLSTLEFGNQAKTIVNNSAVNDELTVVEWKLRWHKERDEFDKLTNFLSKLIVEVEKWRKGVKVPNNEQVCFEIFELRGKSNSEHIKPESNVENAATDTSVNSLLSSIIDSAEYAQPKKLNFELEELQNEMLLQKINYETYESKKIEKSISQIQVEEQFVTSNKLNNELLQFGKCRFYQQYKSMRRQVQNLIRILKEFNIFYDQNSRVFSRIQQDFQLSKQKLNALLNILLSVQVELHNIKADSSFEKQSNQLLIKLVRDLNESVKMVDKGILKNKTNVDIEIEKKLQVAVLRTSEIKSKVRVLRDRCEMLENSEIESNEQINEFSKFREQTKYKLFWRKLLKCTHYPSVHLPVTYQLSRMLINVLIDWEYSYSL
ncbi:kinesin heavy chain-like protein, partial [Dinothrombium tinctorium]